MILRSLTKHVRDQNWLAVFLDFLIVVVGVFIGIQVANWNEARIEEREEALLIERLVVDFERIGEDAQRSLDFHRDRVSEFKTLVLSLRSGSLAAEDRSAVDRALFIGLSMQTSADRSGTFTELLSSGRANLLKDKALLNELVAYEDFLDRFSFAQEYLMHMSVDLQQPFTARFDYRMDGMEWIVEEDIDLAARVDYDFGALVSDASFHNAAEQLMYVHNIALLWRSRISERIGRIQQMLDEASP